VSGKLTTNHRRVLTELASAKRGEWVRPRAEVSTREDDWYGPCDAGLAEHCFEVGFGDVFRITRAGRKALKATP
jgi:hypothetical protein